MRSSSGTGLNNPLIYNMRIECVPLVVDFMCLLKNLHVHLDVYIYFMNVALSTFENQPGV